jgi:hypothetical protein
VYAGVPIGSEVVTIKTKLHRMTGNRCVQLTTIQRNVAGKALVADVKAKNLGASSVDLLRIVKVRRRRWLRTVVCSGLPAARPPGVLRTREYSRS